MQAPTLRFLADMNISPATVNELRRAGWDIFRVSDQLAPRTSDEEILVRTSQREVVISHDLDFSSLLALAGHRSPSLITLRLSSADPVITATRLKEAVQASEALLANGCVVTVDDQTIRVRELPIE